MVGVAEAKQTRASMCTELNLKSAFRIPKCSFRNPDSWFWATTGGCPYKRFSHAPQLPLSHAQMKGMVTLWVTQSQPEIILHLEEMAEGLADWERYRASVSLEQMSTDRDTRNMVLHSMLLSIQASIDIANHLIARRGLRTPATYRETLVPTGTIARRAGTGGMRGRRSVVSGRIGNPKSSHALPNP